MTDTRAIRQLGSPYACARKGCTVKAVSFRVVSGRWHVQSYTCPRHLAWAVSLEALTETTAGKAGLYMRPAVNGIVTINPPRVVPCMAHTRRTDFSRDVSGEISGAWPTEEGAWR